MRILLFLSICLAGCTPFIESNAERTRGGIEINHQKAEEFIFNLFTKKESVSLVNEK